jgi:hypothetical protein
MSKKWKFNTFRYLEKNWLNDFQKNLERQLNDRDNWLPNKESEPPINNEYAIPLENLRNKK